MCKIEENKTEILENLSYDPHTGFFHWKVPKQGRCLGKPVGTKMGGYLGVFVGGNSFKLHRLAFLFMGEEIPYCVDHINRVRDDNRWCNLRAATWSGNVANTGKYSNNTSGLKGVSFHKNRGKWVAHIGFNGKDIYLGIYKTPEEAHEAYKEAAARLHKEFASFS